jgi:acetate kinase
MLASLGGLDVLVFSAGIGEHDPAVRSAACAGFEFLGLAIDETKNQSEPHDLDISTPESRVRVMVIHVEENWAIARECARKLRINGELTERKN